MSIKGGTSKGGMSIKGGLSIKGESCPDGEAVAQVVGAARSKTSGKRASHDHWAVVTDRRHHVRRTYSAASLEALADRLTRSRLSGRCFAVASVDGRKATEEAVVAAWRLDRIAERNDSCFFAWVDLEPRLISSSPASAAA